MPARADSADTDGRRSCSGAAKPTVERRRSPRQAGSPGPHEPARRRNCCGSPTARGGRGWVRTRSRSPPPGSWPPAAGRRRREQRRCRPHRPRSPPRFGLGEAASDGASLGLPTRPHGTGAKARPSGMTGRPPPALAGGDPGPVRDHGRLPAAINPTAGADALAAGRPRPPTPALTRIIVHTNPKSMTVS